jgi:hypothetical protein
MSFPFVAFVDFHTDVLIIAILKIFTGNLICNDFSLLRFYYLQLQQFCLP